MNKKTINQLNQINKNFYDNVADDFNDSRSYFWRGWGKIADLIIKDFGDKKIKVLDIGCGNGRFAKFLEERRINFDYYGLDVSKKLLNMATKQASPEKDTTFLEFDLTTQINEADFTDFLLKNNFPTGFDLIVSFGVLHHVPSFVLRKEFFSSLSKQLTDEGLLVVTAWQFLDNQKLKERLVSFNEVGINEDKVEENDYLLDWRRGERAIRYCHLATKDEVEKIIAETNLRLVDSYLADSKTNNLNQYYLLKNKK